MTESFSFRQQNIYRKRNLHQIENGRGEAFKGIFKSKMILKMRGEKI